jgi:hypothetical protein
LHVPGSATTGSDSQGPHDLVINLRDLAVGPRARVQVWDEALLIGEVDPPDVHAGTWQAPPLPWRPRAAVARLGLLLVDPDDEQAQVLVRDLAIFDRRVVATDAVTPAPSGE